MVSGFIGASEELVDRPMPVRVNMAAETQERQVQKSFMPIAKDLTDL